MKIEKITKEVHEVTFTGCEAPFTLRSFIESRKKKNMSFKWSEKCFCCEEILPLDEKPYIATVKTIGNRMVCKKCSELNK